MAEGSDHGIGASVAMSVGGAMLGLLHASGSCLLSYVSVGSSWVVCCYEVGVTVAGLGENDDRRQEVC